METITYARHLTWREFQKTKCYKKRLDAELIEDLGLVGARRLLAELYVNLKEGNAILVDGDKIQFPEDSFYM